MNVTEERLKDALAAVGEAIGTQDVPLPAFAERRPRKAAFRRPALIAVSAAAVVAVSGGALAGGYSMTRDVSGRTAASEGTGRDVSVFFCAAKSGNPLCEGRDASREQKDAVRRRVELMPGVGRVTYESKRAASERFRSGFPNDEHLARMLRAGDVPDSLRVHVAGAKDATALMKAVLGSPGVDTVVVGPR